ncbi:MAG TPA: hypothetical protein EYG92_12010 [Lutibacter sp.]|nr:hypothetical protein [Lutibacter sp.]
MKLFKKLAFYAITIVMISFVSCQKESTFEVLDEVAEAPIKVIYYNNGKGIDASMLAFKNLETYKETFLRLEKEVLEWDNAFVEEWGHLDEEAINAKEEEIGYNKDKPLENFEKQYGFSSLRLKYNEALNEWLSHDELSEKNDPDVRYPWERFEMSLMGTNGEVQIGGSIYKYESNRHFVIRDGDIHKLVKLNNNEENVVDNKNVILHDYYLEKSNCMTYGISTWTYTSGDFRIKTQWKVSQNHQWWGDYVKAKTWSYQKRKAWWGGKKKWLLTRRHIEVQIFGTLHPDNTAGTCDYPISINVDNHEYGHDVYVKYSSQNSGSPHSLLTVGQNQLQARYEQSGYGTEYRWFTP